MEDNVKGLIRTCCIVLIISIGLSVVYSAKRPYIYLIDNYDYYNPSATAEGAPHLHQHQPRRSDKNAAGRISVDSGYSGNDYNNKFLHPFIFHDTHRNGEVTEDSSSNKQQDEPPQRPSLNTKISGSSKNHRNGDNGRKRSKKASKKNNNAGKIQESTGVEQTFPFPIPWDWNVRMAQMKKERKSDEERKFKLPRLPTLPTIEFQFSAEINKPTTAATDKESEEDDEHEHEPEDDEAEDDASGADADNSQQQSDEEQEIGSKSKESKESKEDDIEQEPEPERDSEREPEPDQDQDQDDEKEQEQSVEKDQEQSSERDPSAEKEHSDEEVLDASDEEVALNDNPLTRPKKKTRPTPTRITRPSSTFALDPTAFQGITRHNTTSTQSNSNYNNLFEPAAISSPDPNDATKPVIILLNVPKPTELKGDTGSYDSDYLYGDEQKKAWKKKKIQEKKKKKKKKKAKKKKKKKKKKGGGGWWPKPTQRPNKKADIINRLTKVHSNVQEIYNVFKGVISDYVVNRPHIGVEFIHTNSKSPPPHRRKPPPKEDDDDDDDDEKGKGEEKSGEIDVDEHGHDREKSDDRKLRLPGGSSASFEDFEDDQYVAVGGKPTVWNPAEWNYNYPSVSDAETATTLSKRFQECQNAGDTECSTTIIDRPMKYNPPEPLYMETVVSSESGEKPPPRPPYREPPPRISTGSSEKVWVKTWDKDKTGLPLPIDSSELNKS